MRPNCCSAALQVSILVVLVLTSNADGEDPDCIAELLVRRNTVITTFHGHNLTINCTVRFCSLDSVPEVTWYKVGKTSQQINVSDRVNITWTELNRSEGMQFLIFKEILRSDSGLYQCQSASEVSHSINITVAGDDEKAWETDSDDSSSASRNTESMWMYVYSAAGITAFVSIVIIMVVSMRGCKGKSKTPSEAQQVVIPMVETPFPHGGLKPSPRESPSVTPSHSSGRKETPTVAQLKKSPQQNQVHGKVKGDRKKKRNGAEEGTGVVYAALNHQQPSATTPRPRRTQEVSEYATIRVA